MDSSKINSNKRLKGFEYYPMKEFYEHGSGENSRLWLVK